MALTLNSCNIVLNSQIVEALTLGLASTNLNTPLNNTYTFTSGTGANKANEYFSRQHLASASPDSYTLSSLTDALGRSIPFAKIRGFIVQIPAGTDGQDLLIRWPTITAPSTAPTGSPTGSDATIPAGTYLVSFTYVNTNGETTRSNDLTCVVGSTNHIPLTLPSLPTGATGINVYMSTLGGNRTTETKQNLLPITGTSYSILSAQTGPVPPSTNTCYYGGWIGVPPVGVTCRAGGAVALIAPLATANTVTASTGDGLVCDPGANNITYNLLAFGE